MSQEQGIIKKRKRKEVDLVSIILVPILVVMGWVWGLWGTKTSLGTTIWTIFLSSLNTGSDAFRRGFVGSRLC